MSYGPSIVSRAIIDACRPTRWRDQFPRPVATSQLGEHPAPSDPGPHPSTV